MRLTNTICHGSKPWASHFAGASTSEKNNTAVPMRTNASSGLIGVLTIAGVVTAYGESRLICEDPILADSRNTGKSALESRVAWPHNHPHGTPLSRYAKT